jgi:hypothetical protein
MTKAFIVLVIISGVFSSCSHAGKGAHKEEQAISLPGYDSIPLAQAKIYYVERAQKDFGTYQSVVKSKYYFADTMLFDSSYYCQSNYLYFLDSKKQILDSIELAEGCTNGIIIDDVTIPFAFNHPVICVSSPMGSDHYLSEYIEYSSEGLKMLFELPAYAGPITLQRGPDNMLKGYIKDRDELVYDFQDYPISVSLDDYNIKIERPAKQAIGYSTEVTKEFVGYQLSASGDSSVYQLVAGSKILIDSIDRLKNHVRVIVKDTIVVYVPISNLAGRIRVNDAG